MTSVLAIAAIYGVGHLLVYVSVLRRLPAFRRERVIFLYHAISFVGVAAALAVVLSLSVDRDVRPAAALVLAVHAMYSLTFLELWSLSEGGYSLAILRRAASRPGAVEVSSLLGLETVGLRKRTVRLQHLADLGLIERLGATWRLTSRGRAAAAAVKTVSWLVGAPRCG